MNRKPDPNMRDMDYTSPSELTGAVDSCCVPNCPYRRHPSSMYPMYIQDPRCGASVQGWNQPQEGMSTIEERKFYEVKRRSWIEGNIKRLNVMLTRLNELRPSSVMVRAYEVWQIQKEKLELEKIYMEKELEVSPPKYNGPAETPVMKPRTRKTENIDSLSTVLEISGEEPIPVKLPGYRSTNKFEEAMLAIERGKTGEVDFNESELRYGADKGHEPIDTDDFPFFVGLDELGKVDKWKLPGLFYHEINKLTEGKLTPKGLKIRRKKKYWVKGKKNDALISKKEYNVIKKYFDSKPVKVKDEKPKTIEEEDMDSIEMGPMPVASTPSPIEVPEERSPFNFKEGKITNVEKGRDGSGWHVSEASMLHYGGYIGKPPSLDAEEFPFGIRLKVLKKIKELKFSFGYQEISSNTEVRRIMGGGLKIRRKKEYRVKNCKKDSKFSRAETEIIYSFFK